jgi:acyl-CoA reductase-like NAD-dependent aldehyde dehydrogenase
MCVCANRLLVHDRVHDAFAAKLAVRMLNRRPAAT